MTEKESATKKEMFDRLSPCDLDSPYIFVSYSSRDWFRVCTDVYELQRRGYNVWIDEKNLDKTKDSWKEDALGAIRDFNCSLVIFYVSRFSLTSAQCLSEMEETRRQETVYVHFGEVKFICIDVEQIGDIRKIAREIAAGIRDDVSLSKEEKADRTRTLSVFLHEVFNSNNERVRVHPADEPDRRSDYYSEILQSLPPETKVSGEKKDTPAVRREEMTDKPSVNTRAPADDPYSNSAEHASECSARAYRLVKEGKHNEAEPLWLEALNIRRSLAASYPAKYNPDLALNYNNLAILYADTGRRDEAEALHLEALGIRRSLAAADPAKYSPDLALSCNNLAFLYYNAGRRDEAEPLWLEALSIRRSLAAADPGKYNPDLASSCNNLAILYYNTERRDEAESLWLEALNIRRSLAAADPARYSPALAIVCKNLAILYRRMGRSDEAEALEKEADSLRGGN